MDQALSAVGENGKFQKMLSVIVISVAIISPFMAVGFPFLTASPEFLCREKDNFLINFRKCHKKETCDYKMLDVIVDHEKSIQNFAHEFNLFCDRGYLIPIMGTLFFFGAMSGSVVFGFIPDTYGREKIYKYLSFVLVILHLNLLFIQSAFHLLVVNFFCGMLFFIYSMSTLIITEYFARDKAATIMSFNNAVFPTTGIFLSCFFMFINNWRLLFTITSVASMFVCYLNFKYFVESPRWLIAKNRLDECLEVLGKIAAVNGTEESFKNYIKANQGIVYYNI
jgi:MFS family permease